MSRSKDKFEEYQKRFPNLFKEYPRSGFDLRPGWEGIVRSLCEVLEHHIAYKPEDQRGRFYVAQVKEKFGTLRFYMAESQDDYMSGAIALTEYMSGSLCEECGNYGQRRTGGWVLTLCDFHHNLREEKKREEAKKWAQTNQVIKEIEEEEEDE